MQILSYEHNLINTQQLLNLAANLILPRVCHSIARDFMVVHGSFLRNAQALKNGEIQLVINTPIGRLSQYDDSYIRKDAIKYRVSYITTVTADLAAVEGIVAKSVEPEVKVQSLQEYHAGIK